jgi:hypothetical protein
MRISAVYADTIGQTEFDEIVALRESYCALSRRVELHEAHIRAKGEAVIKRLENGAIVNAACAVSIRVTQRRYPAWKSHFVEVCGAQAADRVQQETPPTLYKKLVISSGERS